MASSRGREFTAEDPRGTARNFIDHSHHAQAVRIDRHHTLEMSSVELCTSNDFRDRTASPRFKENTGRGAPPSEAFRWKYRSRYRDRPGRVSRDAQHTFGTSRITCLLAKQRITDGRS